MSSQNTLYKNLNQYQLVELAQKGDLKALEELLRNEQKNIFATFSYLSNKREDVFDLTQEAMLKVAKNLKNLKEPKHFKSWLNKIVTNLFYDELRKCSRRPDTLSIDDDNDTCGAHSIVNSIPDTKCKPNEKCISLELEEIIRAEISNLPGQFKIAIVLRELHGLSYEEIADITKSSIGTVKSRISRARSKLQDGLKSYI